MSGKRRFLWPRYFGVLQLLTLGLHLRFDFGCLFAAL